MLYPPLSNSNRSTTFLIGHTRLAVVYLLIDL